MNEAAPSRRIYSVKEFTNRLAAFFARHGTLSNIAIQGEVSDYRTFGNGHVSFRLKEEQAVIECIAWSDKRRELPQLENGMAVVATGSIGVRQERGCYQLVVEHLEPTGRGALFLLYQQLKEKFRAEGLFEDERKRAVPRLPRRVALISARGKAMEDFISTLARKAPFVEVVFLETQVQGQGAEIEIATTLDAASTLDVDVVVLTRGGGSYEDLFPFNLEPVVRGIVRSRHPVLTAIGHSGDHHLADDAADRSFGTPTAAAEHIAQGWTFAQRRVQEAQHALDRAMRNVLMQAYHRAEDAKRELQRSAERLLERKRARLLQLSAQIERRSPNEILARNRERLLRAKNRFDTRLVQYFGDAHRVLERSTAHLEGMNPLAPLVRGYAIVTRDGKAVRDAASLHKGDAIEARFERGRAGAIVESVGNDG